MAMCDATAEAGRLDDGVLLATAGYDHTVKLWQPHTAVCRRTCQHQDSQVNALAFQPDCTMLAAAGYQHVRIYDVHSSDINPTTSLEGVTKNVVTVGYHRDSRWMFTAGEDGSARIWDIKTGSVHCQRVFQNEQPVTCAVLHPDQVHLVIGDQTGAIHQWDLRCDKQTKMVPEPGCAFQCIDINSSGTRMAAINTNGMCYLWSLGEGVVDCISQARLIVKQVVHNKAGLKCRFSQDGRLLCTTSADHSACVWSLPPPSPPQPLSLPGDRGVNGVDGDGGEKLLLHLQQRLTWRHNDDSQRWVWDCAFSSDAKYLITASSDEHARLWCVESGKVLRTYKGHTKAVTALAFFDHD